LARHYNNDVKTEGTYQLDFFARQEQQIREEIEKLDVNTMTPIEAMNKLNELKKLIAENIK